MSPHTTGSNYFHPNVIHGFPTAPRPRKPTGNECKCCSCHTIFSSLTGFDSHWIKTPTGRKCPTHDELDAKGYTRNNRGAWTPPVTDQQRAALAKLVSRRSKILALDTQ